MPTMGPTCSMAHGFQRPYATKCRNKQLTNMQPKLQRWLLNKYRAIAAAATKHASKDACRDPWQPPHTHDEANMPKSIHQIQNQP